MRPHILAMPPLIAVFALGCGSSETSGLATTTNDSSDQALAATATQLLDVTGEATSYAVANTYMAAPVAVASIIPTIGGRRIGVDWINVSDIDFKNPTDIATTINLDATDENGNDLFPNASGELLLSGTLTSSSRTPGSGDSATTGHVAYDPVRVTALTTITVVNETNGNTASWPTGTSHDGTWRINYERTNRNNWSMTMQGTRTVTDKNVTITSPEGNSRTGVVNADWQHTRLRAKVDGEKSPIERTLNGTRDVVWTNDSGDERTVSWNVVSLDEIYLTIDGETTGPFTFEELKDRGHAPGRDR